MTGRPFPASGQVGQVDGITPRERARLDGWRVHLAKWHASRWGCRGRVGGWIYDVTGRPIAQGWAAYYEARRAHIWALALGLGASEIGRRPWAGGWRMPVR